LLDRTAFHNGWLQGKSLHSQYKNVAAESPTMWIRSEDDFVRKAAEL
jgi:hypothetical protein